AGCLRRSWPPADGTRTCRGQSCHSGRTPRLPRRRRVRPHRHCRRVRHHRARRAHPALTCADAAGKRFSEKSRRRCRSGGGPCDASMRTRTTHRTEGPFAMTSAHDPARTTAATTTATTTATAAPGTRGGALRRALWVPQILLAAFLLIASALPKFAGQADAVETFELIG